MTVRVLSYPPRHDYVDRLTPDAADLVHRDEPWPSLPRFYDPHWLSRHAGDWDLAHLHFTWEQYPPDRLAAVLAAHRGAGTPVVWTAHDLRNPHTPDAEADEPYLRLLAAHADHVVTLTAGACRELRHRFDRDAQTIPHGPVLAPELAVAWRARRKRPGAVLRVVVHAKSLRASLDWRSAVDAVTQLAAAGWSVRAEVLVHTHAPGRKAVEEAASPAVSVRVHDPLSFDELCSELVGADALVLPYRWGTHSGLLELAADLAVPVLAADVGHLRDQAPAIRYPPGAAGLARAIRRLLTEGPGDPVPLAARRAAHRSLIVEHRALYDALVTSRKSRGRPACVLQPAPGRSAV